MKIKELLKEIKGVFKPPVKEYYIGKFAYGTPYFQPINYCDTIIKIRKLKFREVEDLFKYVVDYPHLENRPESIYSNLPMVRRTKDWIKKTIFGDYLITIGWPFMIKQIPLGWKWKYESIRYEWYPMFQIYFFKYQFVIKWIAPDKDNDRYYEQILWYLKGSNKDLQKAERTWGWTDYKTKEST